MTQENLKNELSADFIAELDSNVVNLAIASIDSKQRADELTVDSATNLARLLGTNPDALTWDLTQAHFIECIMLARKVTEKTAKNLWYEICKVMEVNFELTKPKAQTGDAKRMSAKRAELEAMTDAELEAQGLFKEIGARKEKALKEKNKAHAQAIKQAVKDNEAWCKENLVHNHALMAFLKNPANLEKVIALAKKSS